jgi:hypothetical protein
MTVGLRRSRRQKGRPKAENVKIGGEIPFVSAISGTYESKKGL